MLKYDRQAKDKRKASIAICLPRWNIRTWRSNTKDTKILRKRVSSSFTPTNLILWSAKKWNSLIKSIRQRQKKMLLSSRTKNLWNYKRSKMKKNTTRANLDLKFKEVRALATFPDSNPTQTLPSKYVISHLVLLRDLASNENDKSYQLPQSRIIKKKQFLQDHSNGLTSAKGWQHVYWKLETALH